MRFMFVFGPRGETAHRVLAASVPAYINLRWKLVTYCGRRVRRTWRFGRPPKMPVCKDCSR